MTKPKMPAIGPIRTLLPLVLGLSVVTWMLVDAVRENGGWSAIDGALTLPNWSWSLALLVGCVTLRDAGYVLRLKWLSNGELTWKQAIETTVLWEFASAITPGIVGGGAVAIWGLHRQGMRAGKSTALVFSTALLDELFYVVAVPPLVYFLGQAVRPEGLDHVFGWGIFWAGWSLMLLLALVIAFGLFLAPNSTHRIVRGTAGWGLLKRWKRTIIRFAEDLRRSAEEMKSLSLLRWSGAMVATMVSWSARFLSLVAVMGMIVAPLQSLDALLIVARQLVMWVFLLVSPTPGSSGVAEWLLQVFFGKWLSAAPSPIAPAITMLIWRMATHFVYLLLGVLVIPSWLNQTGRKNATGSSDL